MVAWSSGQKRDLAWPRLVEMGGAVLSGKGNGHHMPGRWVKVPDLWRKSGRELLTVDIRKRPGVRLL